jgi:hypothetical protein
MHLSCFRYIPVYVSFDVYTNVTRLRFLSEN